MIASANDQVIGVDRLHRLRPSDMDLIAYFLKTTNGAWSIIVEFACYLISIRSPRAVDLDDVARVTAQLHMTGLWRAVEFSDFLTIFGGALPLPVIDALRQTGLQFGLPIEPDRHDLEKFDAPLRRLHQNLKDEPPDYSSVLRLIDEFMDECGVVEDESTLLRLKLFFSSPDLLKPSITRLKMRIVAVRGGKSKGSKWAIIEKVAAKARAARGSSGRVSQIKTKVESGTVKFFNSTKGFGFISPDSGGKDVLFTTYEEARKSSELVAGEKVDFAVIGDRHSNALLVSNEASSLTKKN